MFRIIQRDLLLFLHAILKKVKQWGDRQFNLPDILFRLQNFQNGKNFVPERASGWADGWLTGSTISPARSGWLCRLVLELEVFGQKGAIISDALQLKKLECNDKSQLNFPLPFEMYSALHRYPKLKLTHWRSVPGALKGRLKVLDRN